jgi:transposase InsO family protein
VKQAIESLPHVSQRRACQVLGQHRSTQRYPARRRDDERKIEQRMLELVRTHPRFGYRRIWALLRREGVTVNRKRVYRLWKKNGLKVPSRKIKKRSVGVGENGIVRKRAEHPNHVWTWDFVFDRTSDGRSLKWLSVVDEYTRRCLALEVDRRITSNDVIDVLRGVMQSYGLPDHIRSDNGPEFIAAAIRSWLGQARVKTLYIEPGAPWENGFVESFQSRLRDELLECELFTSVTEARVLSRMWRRSYNDERPHSSLGYKTPSEFAAACGERGRKDSGFAADGWRLSPPEDTGPVSWTVSSDGEGNESSTVVKLS